MNATETTRKWDLTLGKIDDVGRGRKLNRVTLEVELRRKKTVAPHLDVDLNPCDEFTELSIVGEVWNAAGSDITSGGQNLETVEKHFGHDQAVRRLVEIWKRWHCNGMKAGTREQNNFLADARVKVEYPRSQYDADCALLEKANLLTVTGGPEVRNANDQYVRRNYKYGSAWLCEPLPADVEAEVVRLCDEIAARGAAAPAEPKTFAEAHGIEMIPTQVAENPSYPDAPRDSRHWACLFTWKAKKGRDRWRNRLTVHFTQGSAHTKPPTAMEVLGCLAQDAQSAEYTFEEWCRELGMDPDSRKDEKTYKAVQKLTKSLRRFLGEALFKELVDGVN